MTTHQSSYLNNPPSLARTLRQYRWECGISQATLAAHLGVTQQAVALWERGLRQKEDDLLWRGVVHKLCLDWAAENLPAASEQPPDIDGRLPTDAPASRDELLDARIRRLVVRW